MTRMEDRCTYGQAPEVHEATHIDEGEEDAGEDQQTGGQVGDQEEGGHADTDQRDSDVAVGLH